VRHVFTRWVWERTQPNPRSKENDGARIMEVGTELIAVSTRMSNVKPRFQEMADIVLSADLLSGNRKAPLVGSFTKNE
jgi:hypothetical protein